METNTTTDIPPTHIQYRACLDLILGSALKGEMSLDMAFKVIDAMNLANSEAYGRGYECARNIYKTY
jgi:hypothetical protein